MGKNRINRILLEIFQRLYANYGPQHWWPGDGPFEVMVGAVLTQSTAWTNVEKAIFNLKKAGALSPRSLREMPPAELSRLLRPCGYFNTKAARLKALVEWYGSRCGDNPERLSATDSSSLREELLQVHGIGEETADSILLYAGSRPLFVIDAYTRRIVDRLGLCPEGPKYSHYQKLFMDNLAPDVRMFNEYHALLVKLGKDVCRKNRPLCPRCCLEDLCRFSGTGEK